MSNPLRVGALRYLYIALAALLIISVSSLPYLLLGQPAQNAQNQLGATQSQLGASQQKASLGDNLANKITIACSNSQIVDQLRALGACQAASQVKEVPVPVPINGTNGVNGTNGTNGRGITSTAIINGHFFVSYSDNTTSDLGQIVGANGKDGKDGKDGTNGRGITLTSLGGATGIDLIVTYTDGSTTDVGKVVGKDGQNGTNGVNGKDGVNGQNGTNGKDGTNGVSPPRETGVTINSSNHLIVSYSDGTTSDAGLVPAGPQGVGVQSVALQSGGPTGCQLIFTLVNPANNISSTQTVPINSVVCPPAPPPTTTSSPPTS